MKSLTAGQATKPLPGESDLVYGAKSGNADAFAQLYDGYVDRVYRYIFFRVSDDLTAEDLTSQVFLKAWENLVRYEPRSSPFLAWLYTIARNTVIDHYRTSKQSVSLDEVTSLAGEGDGLDDQIEQYFEAESLREALYELTDEQQQVLILKFIAGFTTEEVARQMDKREGAVRALQMRALQALAKRMKEDITA